MKFELVLEFSTDVALEILELVGSLKNFRHTYMNRLYFQFGVQHANTFYIAN